MKSASEQDRCAAARRLRTVESVCPGRRSVDLALEKKQTTRHEPKVGGHQMYIAYWDDTKLSGESASKPHIRFPSYRQVRQKNASPLA